jgi:hypothetical protein
MSGSKLGFWARLGGMAASLFLKGKDKETAIEVSDRVGDALDGKGK